MRVVSKRRKPDNLVKMPRRKRRRITAKMVTVMVLAAIAIGAVAVFWTVGSIRVVGVSILSPTQMVVESKLQPGDRMFMTNLGKVRARLQSNPQVAQAVVQRQFPDTVLIRVTERAPLVTLDSKPELAADRSGRLFAKAPDAKLPVLTGWKATQPKSGSVLGARSEKVLAAYSKFPSGLVSGVVKVDLLPDVTLTLDSGTQIRFGSTDKLAAKAAAANAVLADATARNIKLEYIDVRAPTAPVARPVIVATPVPAKPTRTSAPATKATPKPVATAKAPARTPRPAATPAR